MELQGKVIQLLGDSITAGAGASDRAHAYPGVLQTLTGATVRVDGIGGTRIARQQGEDNQYDKEKSQNYVTRYAAMADDADVVVVFGGTNDYGHGDVPFGTMDDRTPDTFCGACHLLFRGLIEKYPLARIAVMTPLQRQGCTTVRSQSGQLLIEYVDAIIEIAGYYSLPVLDLYRNLGVVPDLPCHTQAFCPDGLHPNNAGAARIAEFLANFLKTL